MENFGGDAYHVGWSPLSADKTAHRFLEVPDGPSWKPRPVGPDGVQKVGAGFNLDPGHGGFALPLVQLGLLASSWQPLAPYCRT